MGEEKCAGRMEEWDAFHDNHDLYSERWNKSKQGNKQEAANDRVWLVWGRREAEGKDGCGKGAPTAAFGMERKRHSKRDGKPQRLALQGEESSPGRL